MTPNTRDVAKQWYVLEQNMLSHMPFHPGVTVVRASDYDSLRTSLDAAIRERNEARTCVQLLADRMAILAARKGIPAIDEPDLVRAVELLARCADQPGAQLPKLHKGTSVVGYAKCNVPDCWCASE